MACPWCRKFVPAALLGELPSEDPELPGRYQSVRRAWGYYQGMPKGFAPPRICSCGTVYCPLVEEQTNSEGLADELARR